jgi:hypothetical protein
MLSHLFHSAAGVNWMDGQMLNLHKYPHHIQRVQLFIFKKALLDSPPQKVQP